MCGIAGVLYRDPDRPVEAGILREMGVAIAHRGPDAEGMWSAPGIGLVHRRLSIIDLESGQQPLANEDGSVWSSYNGEIYNYQEIREQLSAKGHVLRTQSDTEVLVHLYEDIGDRLVERLRGMFAFAIWDSRQRKLLLARDRVGLKPLYYYRDEEKLLFGSEIKAILVHPSVDRAVDPEALAEFITFGFVPGERSIFRRVRKLRPGHVASFSSQDFSSPPRRYWQLTVQPDEQPSLAEWKETVDQHLRDTVDLHTIADVPVGAFLSGGLDSSIVVGALAENALQPLATFSIGFHESGFSELPHAREVAQRFGCEHREEIVTPEAVASLEDLTKFYDEPFADASAIPTLHLARLARRHVKVALSGDGGDEAFGGYARYAHDLWEAGLRNRLPGWFRRGPVRWASGWWPKADWLPRPLRAKSLLTNLSLNPEAAYANTLALCRPPLLRKLLHGDVRAELNGHELGGFIQESYLRAKAGDSLAGMLNADIEHVLPEDFLTKVDRASMSCGLEVRPPFVDHTLLELTARLPSRWKVQGGETKWLLKQLYADRLPACAVSRRKQGFDLPIDQWLKGPLRGAVEESVLSPNSPIAGWICQDAVRQIYRHHVAGVGRHGAVLWSLLVLGNWAEAYLTPEPRTAVAH